MSSLKILSDRDNAEIFTGEEMCRQKILEVMESLDLPRGLLPMYGLSEIGYNKATGFVWMRREKKITHFYPTTKTSASYDTEVTAFVEHRRMKRITGVKSRELLIWFVISDIYIVEPGKITFKTSGGLSKSQPISAFDQLCCAAQNSVQREK